MNKDVHALRLLLTQLETTPEEYLKIASLAVLMASDAIETTGKSTIASGIDAAQLAIGKSIKLLRTG